MKIKDSLLADNLWSAVLLEGAEATLERTVVRDTGPEEKRSIFGYGIVAYKTQSFRSRLVLRDCLLARNMESGLLTLGAEAILERTVVQATRPDAEGAFGAGVIAAYGQGDAAGPSTLTLRQCLVHENRVVGVGVQGSSATIEGTVIQNTLPHANNKSFGNGLAVFKEQASSTVVMRESVVRRHRGAGIWLESADATIERCQVLETAIDEGLGVYGDGIQASLETPGEVSTVRISDTLVEQSARAGLVLLAVGGAVSRSVFRGGVFAIDLELAAAPEIAEDNVYQENSENGVTAGQNLAASPPPLIPTL